MDFLDPANSFDQLIKDPLLRKLMVTFLVVAVLMAISEIIKRKSINKISDNSKRYRARKLLNGFTLVVSLLVGASVFSDKMNQLAVFLGVAGAGVAFALQEVIASIAGWFAVTFGGYYRSGDRVQLGGIRGDVIDIGVLRTTIMECGDWVKADLYNGRIVRVANSFVFKEPVFNYSSDFEFLWDEIVIPIRPGTSVDKVQTVLESVAQEVVGDYAKRAKHSWKLMVDKYRIEDARVEPMVTTHLLMDRVNFTLRYVVDYKLRRSTQHELTKRIITEFEKNGIKIAASIFELDRIPKLEVELGKSQFQ